jgi:hypothetical protein
MKKRKSPQEKKALAYERDHYVSAGESRHAFRKKWPKKKAMMNQIHRHRADQAIHQLEKLGDLDSIDSSPIEVTAEQLRKVDPRKKLRKWGVMSLKKYVERNQEARVTRPEWARKGRERVDSKYKNLIKALEQTNELPKAKQLLREITYFDWHLTLFLKRNPDWRPRLEKQLSQIKRSTEKIRMHQEKKEAEKRRAEKLLHSIQRQLKVICE